MHFYFTKLYNDYSALQAELNQFRLGHILAAAQTS